MKAHPLCLLLYLLVLSCFFTGCDGNPPTYPVSGKVVFPSGSAVRMGTIETKSRTLGVNARGKIQSDGTFQLTTFEPDDGAVAGVHDCVVVQLVIGEDLKSPGSSFGVVDPKHNSYQTSGLTIEVKPDSTNQFVLRVDAFRGKELSEKHHQHD
jgi:hypothetical protein